MAELLRHLSARDLAPAPRGGEAWNVIEQPSQSFWWDAWRRLRQNRMAMAGLVTIVILAAAAVFGPALSPYTYDYQQLDLHDQPPSAAHWFGTDMLGRDLFTRVLFGARISLAVGILASLVALGIGVIYGAVAGFYGGQVDNVMMRIVDVIYGLPFLLYVILLMVVLGPGLQNVFLALGAVYWTGMARIVRAEILSLKEREFVMAARTLGVPPRRLLLRHLIPNAVGPIIVTLTLLVPEAIFSEAFLSYLGLGVRAPIASWGVLVADGYKAIRAAPWEVIFPALFISITMLAFGFLGDGLRDALDPRMRNR
ncbi:MAG: ABC transporter permease [Firmicutes bacterium]|nr:ABC transporter permease [Bacillota bacterium]